MTKKISEKNMIYLLRQKNGLTQKDVAEAIGTTATQISKLENGERKLAPEWLERLSVALHCTKAELLGEEPATELTEKEKVMLETFQKLTPEQQAMIQTIADSLAQPAVKSKAE